jgi:serine/threonine protein kinase
MTDLTGTTLGEYQVVSRIGKGGMGVVYEGRHPLIGKRVAVKVLTEEASTQAEAVDRFLAEARAVNAIRHRGIVDIFGFGKVPGGSQYFVMELLEGLPFDEVIRLDALDAAHHAGVIHRDIKPSNLFLVDTGRGTPYVKLLDFGIAKLVPFRGQTTPQTNVNAVVGTPDYMAPEQARGQPISGLTDIYALGCVLYELLTGHRIFTADGALEVMFAHVEREPERPSKLNHSIPSVVDDLVLHFVAKKPSDRPQNAHAAREEVHAALRKMGATGSLPAPSDRHLQPVRSMPISGSNPNLPALDSTLLVPSTQSTKGVRNPILLAIVAAVSVIAGAMAFVFWPQPAPSPVVVEDPPVVVAEPPPPVIIPEVQVAEIPPEVVPAAVVDAGVAPAAVIKPVGPKKDPLAARLVKLKAQLAERDKKTGERDRILHRLLDGAEKDLQTAKTSEDRKAVSAQFDDLQSQLR